ncbi:MAG: hypothetical protein ACLFU7_11690 [Armatimonadota bacterium]
MEPILKWQYDQLIKELILLQDHQVDRSCPCGNMEEMCTRKHLMTIEAYAQETVPMDDNPEYSQLLRQLADEARRYRVEEERSLCGDEVCLELTDWCRNWRKEFEAYSLACEMDASERRELVAEPDDDEGVCGIDEAAGDADEADLSVG